MNIQPVVNHLARRKDQFRYFFKKIIHFFPVSELNQVNLIILLLYKEKEF